MKTDYCRRHGCEFEEPTEVIVEDRAVIWIYQCIHQPTKSHVDTKRDEIYEEPMGPRCEEEKVIRFDLVGVVFEDVWFSAKESWPEQIESAFIDLEIDAYQNELLSPFHRKRSESNVSVVDVDPDEDSGHVVLEMETDYGHIQARYGA